jgi:hypothetical protein
MPTVTSYILYNLGPLPPHSFKILINVINTLLALSQEKWEEVEAKEKKAITVNHRFPITLPGIFSPTFLYLPTK